MAPTNRISSFMNKAMLLARDSGSGVALMRHWVEDVAVRKYTVAALGTALGLGVMVGWLVKRR
jgi:hypothetical protein